MSEFIDYLRTEKKKAENTLIAYERDINSFRNFLLSRGVTDMDKCSESDAVSYVLELGNQKKSKATVNRKISALRMYYEYCIRCGKRDDNPFSRIKSARGERRDVDYLSGGEVERLLELPDDSPKGIRDTALLEFMYGTGARVTEVVRLCFEDINLRMSFVTLKDVNDESRIVPLGKYAKAAMEKYIGTVYDELAGRPHSEEDHVFVNMRGEALTRQGIWKIMKDYGSRINAGSRMTPQILRDSFAVHILQNGGDLKTLQELMGFEDMSIGIAYLAVTEIHVKDVFNRTHPRA